MNQHGKSLILIDESNLFYAFRKFNWEVDYYKFYKWFISNFDVLSIYFCSGLISKKTFFDKHTGNTLTDFIKCKQEREKFFKSLKSTGYKIMHKPVASLYDSTKGEYKRKCNFDVEITILALDRIADYEELVLCSGDGDFTKLLKYVKGKYKKTTIIGHKDRINWNLEESANRVIYIDDLKQYISK
jgi:uncharacterized LabA/DUF88 family protein